MNALDPLSVAAEITAVLEELRIPYVIGGSVAASLLGEPRSTLDLDIMIDCGADQTRELATRLSETCYVDEETAVDAARMRRSFNAIHLATSLKIDFFFAEDSEFARGILARRTRTSVGGVEMFFYSAPDLIVRKLLWFRLADETSERQWRDVVGLLRMNRGRLNAAGLRVTAVQAGVADLLDTALEESK
jgi:hypothetical protein